MRRVGVLLAWLWLLPAALAAQGPELQLEGGGEAVRIAADTHRGYPAHPASALRAFGGPVDAEQGRAVAILYGDTVRFDVGSPFFAVGGRIFQLADAVYALGGEIYIPRQFFTEWIPRQYPQRVTAADGGLRLADGVRPARPTAELPPPPQAGQTPRLAGRTSNRSRVVVIDPGHGGRDPGKIGPFGIREKDITLAVGLRLAEVLRRRGYEVHLTRSRDTLVALADRPRIANRLKGDRSSALFLSLHANSGRSNVRGFETFFLSEPRTEDERRVAEMENAAVQYENGEDPVLGGDLDMILKGLLNNYYLRASHELAEVVQDEMATFHPGPNRGVKQAGFRVLVGALMPAVLVEMAFLSHAQEARMLASRGFQDRVASSLADSVDRFFTEHEHLLRAEPDP